MHIELTIHEAKELVNSLLCDGQCTYCREFPALTKGKHWSGCIIPRIRNQITAEEQINETRKKSTKDG